MSWYWINTKKACGGVETNNGNKITRTAPYFKFLKGQDIRDAALWLLKKKTLLGYKKIK